MYFAHYLGVTRVERAKNNQIWASIAIQKADVSEPRVVGVLLANGKRSMALGTADVHNLTVPSISLVGFQRSRGAKS